MNERSPKDHEFVPEQKTSNSLTKQRAQYIADYLKAWPTLQHAMAQDVLNAVAEIERLRAALVRIEKAQDPDYRIIAREAIRPADGGKSDGRA